MTPKKSPRVRRKLNRYERIAPLVLANLTITNEELSQQTGYAVGTCDYCREATLAIMRTISRLNNPSHHPTASAAGRGKAWSKEVLLKISFEVTEDDLPAASDRLSREIERLEVEGKGKLNIKIHYPKRFAYELGIAEGRDSARYRGHTACGSDDVPYAIVIEY